MGGCSLLRRSDLCNLCIREHPSQGDIFSAACSALSSRQAPMLEGRARTLIRAAQITGHDAAWSWESRRERASDTSTPSTAAGGSVASSRSRAHASRSRSSRSQALAGRRWPGARKTTRAGVRRTSRSTPLFSPFWGELASPGLRSDTGDKVAPMDLGAPDRVRGRTVGNA